MAKESYYFAHDYNARNDDKILQLRAEFGAEGYGIFWMVVETMAENENGGVKASLIGGLSLGYGVAKDKLLSVINACIEVELFYESDGYYFSKRLLSHKEIRKSLSDYGSKGAKLRWGGYKGGNSPPNAKERKGKERKIKGVYFDLPNQQVFFEDNSFLKVDDATKDKIVTGILKPHEIIKPILDHVL